MSRFCRLTSLSCASLASSSLTSDNFFDAPPPSLLGPVYWWRPTCAEHRGLVTRSASLSQIASMASRWCRSQGRAMDLTNTPSPRHLDAVRMASNSTKKPPTAS